MQVFAPHAGGLIPFGTEQIYPCFYETQNYQLVIRNKSDQNVRFYHENIALRRAVKPLGNEIISGVLNFGNDVGYTDLTVQVGGQDTYGKADYRVYVGGVSVDEVVTKIRGLLGIDE